MSQQIFAIDLLKGQGIPVRSKPDKIVLLTAAISVPAIIAITMLGCYARNNVLISIQKQKIALYEKNISKLSEAQALLAQSEKARKYTSDCLSEVAQGINKHYQWTPALIEIVNLMPESILLRGLKVDRELIKKVVPSKTQGGADAEILVPKTNLRISITEKSQSMQEQNVRVFKEKIRNSTFFKPFLENISVSQGIDSFKDADVITYQIDCSYKP